MRRNGEASYKGRTAYNKHPSPERKKTTRAIPVLKAENVAHRFANARCSLVDFRGAHGIALSLEQLCLAEEPIRLTVLRVALRSGVSNAYAGSSNKRKLSYFDDSVHFRTCLVAFSDSSFYRVLCLSAPFLSPFLQ